MSTSTQDTFSYFCFCCRVTGRRGKEHGSFLSAQFITDMPYLSLCYAPRFAPGRPSLQLVDSFTHSQKNATCDIHHETCFAARVELDSTNTAQRRQPARHVATCSLYTHCHTARCRITDAALCRSGENLDYLACIMLGSVC